MEKLYGTIELTIVWKNWMTNLGDKFNVNIFWNKLGVKFVEIIGLINLLEKGVDNLVTKLSEQFSGTLWLKIW